jgi:hypothetical protein
MLSFFVSEALRDLRRAGRVGLSAILLITLSLGRWAASGWSRSTSGAR